jgi:hypothetical protein
MNRLPLPLRNHSKEHAGQKQAKESGGRSKLDVSTLDDASVDRFPALAFARDLFVELEYDSFCNAETFDPFEAVMVWMPLCIVLLHPFEKSHDLVGGGADPDFALKDHAGLLSRTATRITPTREGSSASTTTSCSKQWSACYAFRYGMETEGPLLGGSFTCP